jgi:hypothetical protein
MRRAALIIAAAVLAFTLVPARALADADPASDILLGESVFFPYSPPVSAALQKQLTAETTAAGRAHFPIKVALIASAVDLGAIPNLFAKPQEYANFLDQEISFQAARQPLLVVMPQGYGVRGLSASATAAAPSLPRPTSSQSDVLARAAIVAVRKLAAASGHPIGNVAGASSGGTGGGTIVIVSILVVAAVLGAAAVFAVRRRSARKR